MYLFIQALLDDDNGISDKAYRELIKFLSAYEPKLERTVRAVAKCTDGRWYIPEGCDLEYAGGK
tara:strand:- start:97 stop:288 length:192 start_codon:yes stop_codon:yes gene_type:complete